MASRLTSPVRKKWPLAIPPTEYLSSRGQTAYLSQKEALARRGSQFTCPAVLWGQTGYLSAWFRKKWPLAIPPTKYLSSRGQTAYLSQNEALARSGPQFTCPAVPRAAGKIPVRMPPVPVVIDRLPDNLDRRNAFAFISAGRHLCLRRGCRDHGPRPLDAWARADRLHRGGGGFPAAACRRKRGGLTAGGVVIRGERGARR